MGVLPQTVLSACQALWKKSRKASLQSAILFGTAGLGKSFFLRQFAAQLAPDACWLVGQGFLQGLLSTGFTHLQNERNPDFVSAARRYCPDLPWTVLVSHMPLERERAWAAVGHAVERLAVRLGGLCLLLEDIHGYNTDDLAALRFLYRQWLHLKAPIFILSSSRPKLIDGLLEDLAVDAQLYQADAVQVFELHALD